VEEVTIDLGYTGDEIAGVCSRYISIGNAARAAVLNRRGIDLTGALRHLVDPRILAHIDEGRQITAIDAKLDDIVRTRILDGFSQLFEEADVLVSPTIAIAGVSNAHASEHPGPTSVAGEPVDPFLGWALTVPVNFCGYPAINVPAGRVDGLPIGIQIVAPHGREDLCIEVAAAIEEAAPWQHTYVEANEALVAKCSPYPADPLTS
jgi:amidase/aspartyl-tRNA(Asn)/glutamyl-tRNA(Gln) amidotransferase subunit A